MPVDVLILKPENHRKQALVADMESTIIRNEMLDEMAYEAEIGEQVAEITRRAMNGELDFYEAIRERVGLLKGQPASLLDRRSEEHTSELQSLMRLSYAVLCLKKKTITNTQQLFIHLITPKHNRRTPIYITPNI